jgi:hypothetical protein
MSSQQLLHLRLQLRQQRTAMCNVLPVLFLQLVQLLLCGGKLLLALCKLLLQALGLLLLLLIWLLLAVVGLQLPFQKIDLDKHLSSRAS